MYQLTRSSDADNSPPGEIHYGDYTLVLSGDTNGGFGFICNTQGTIDIGITPINYIQFNAAQAVTAGYGLQEAVSNVISIDPLVTQEKITLTTTGSGAATLISNTLNIPQADNYWTKTGNDIVNNNIGKVEISAGGNSTWEFAEGVYMYSGNASVYLEENRNVLEFSGSFSRQYFDVNGISLYAPTNAIVSLNSGSQSSNKVSINISQQAGGFKIDDSRATPRTGIEYAADYSANYTNRSLVDKGYVNNRLVVETASPYTLTNADSGGIVIFTASTTLTIPTGLANGFECTFVTLSGVTLTVVSTGNTLNNATSTNMLPQLSFTLKRMLAADTYIATGNL